MTPPASGIVATIGNKMDINETDILEYLSDDDHISVIVMYMEDIRSGKRFLDVAGRAAVRKPVRWVPPSTVLIVLANE